MGSLGLLDYFFGDCAYCGPEWKHCAFRVALGAGFVKADAVVDHVDFARYGFHGGGGACCPLQASQDVMGGNYGGILSHCTSDDPPSTLMNAITWDKWQLETFHF